MNEYFMFALALSPLLLMVFLILKLKMPIHYSVLISLVFTAALSALFWEMPVQNLKAAIGYGALKGLWPIVIVLQVFWKFMCSYTILRNFVDG